MNMESSDFNELARRAAGSLGGEGMEHVVKKELLHYDILFCLSQEGLLDRLTFQGGTALRLCYGALRLSEDLDFAGGAGFLSGDLQRIKPCLEHYLKSRYGLELQVKEPDATRLSPGPGQGVSVGRWQVSVVTDPGRPDLPRQRIKIEVADVPAHTGELAPLRSHYTNLLPDKYAGVLLRVESLEEIMADKLTALTCTQTHVRRRDLWDLPWISRQGAAPVLSLVEKKLVDYRRHIGFREALDRRLASLPVIVHEAAFQDEMRRFLPPALFARTAGDADFRAGIESELRRLLHKVKAMLPYQPV